MRSWCSSTRFGPTSRRPTWRTPSANFDGANAAMSPLSPAADHRNLLYRIASGAVLGPLVLVLAFLRYPAVEVALALATAIGLGEWLKLVTGRWYWWPCAAPFVILSVYWFYGIEYALYALAIAAVALGLILAKGI